MNMLLQSLQGVVNPMAIADVECELEDEDYEDDECEDDDVEELEGTLTLAELAGAHIVDVTTIRDDEDGDDMVWLHLSSGLAIGADVHQLRVWTEQPLRDVWPDFTDHLEADSPHIEDDWHDTSGPYLTLADLVSSSISAVATIRYDGHRNVLISLTLGVHIMVRFSRLYVRDGNYESLWGDYDSLLVPENTPLGSYLCEASIHV
jgi:hypothetical protein